MSVHFMRALRALPDQLTGDRVLLRPWQMADAPALFEAVEESRSRLRTWMAWVDDHVSLRDSEDYCKRVAANWTSRTDLALGIWRRDSGRLLGATGFHNIDWEIPSFDLGYWVRDGEEGKGYVAEAVRLQTKLAFEELGARRLVITCDPSNERSSAVPRRLGFVLEGHLRNNLRWSDRALRDTLVFAMIPSDYEAMRIAWETPE